MDTTQERITQPDQGGTIRPALDKADANAARANLERRVYLHDALAAAAAVDAAEQLGVFTRLAAGPATPAALARDCALSERGGGLLLAALTSLGLTEATGDGGYQMALPALDRLHTDVRPLAQVIRTDQPPLAANTPAGAAALYPETAPLMGTLFAPLAERAAAHLAAPDMHILDVGAGAAPWSLALAAREPSCRITAVDLPAVLPTTRRSVGVAGRDAQFAYLPGDCFVVDWGRSTYDLAIAGNLCHLFDADANRRLLSRLFEALRPGGRLAIVDILPDEQRDGPRSVALYALGLMLRTERGRVYPFSTYAGWLETAGYEVVERIDLGGVPPLSLITAQRP